MKLTDYQKQFLKYLIKNEREYKEALNFMENYVYLKKKPDSYVVVTWPDSQYLMELEDFKNHSYLINDDQGMQDFGSSAYFVEKNWLNKVQSEFEICI